MTNYASLLTCNVRAELARRNYLDFVLYIRPDYVVKWFHEYLASRLSAFEKGQVKKLMVLMPPQHGKSELTTRNFPPYLVGKNPDRRIAVVSYNDGMSNGFNRSMQRVIDSPAYLDVFNGTKLNGSDLHSITQRDKVRNTDRLDILSHAGSIMTIGVGGSLTGNPVDIGIIDDPYKDREQARSEAYKRFIREWYQDVFRTRLHNDSQELIIMTSWDEDDLCQWLLRKESDWEVVKFPAIREENESLYDPRLPGEALWPEKHSAEKILKVKATAPVTYNALYQQDPKPNTDVLIFGTWQECVALPEDEKVFWGCDFGYTNDPTAIVKCVRKGDSIYLKECSYQPCGDENGIKAILLANGYKTGQPVYCDHDRELIAAMRRVGISAFDAQKSIAAGIAKVNTFKVFFTADSPNIRMERSRYQYVTYGEVITNVPAEGYDHCFTDNTLIDTIVGPRSIAEIKEGDTVATSGGFRKVLQKWNNGLQQVFLYRMQFGTEFVELECTSNHLIKTDSGWTPISQLQPGVTVYLNSHSTASFTDSIPESDIFHEVAAGCMSQSGGISTANYRQGTRSTTKTATRGITGRITWRPKKVVCTHQIMAKHGMPLTRNGQQISAQRGRKRLKFGTLRMRAGHGIGSTQRPLALAIKTTGKAHADNVGRNTKRSWQGRRIAPTSAKALRVGHQAWTMCNVNAHSAELHSQSTATLRPQLVQSHVLQRIVGRPAGIQQVYDLTVEGVHEYFANGILVHNCMDASRYAVYTHYFKH